MSTPSKEALEAAFDLFKKRYCFGSDNDNATIIDRHFEPLRQRSEQAEAHVKELEAEIRRLEHENDGLERRRQYETDLVCAAVLEANARGVSFGSAELCSRVDELRAIRAANAELAGALRHLKETLNRNGYATSDADAALARHGAGEPEAQT